MMNFIVWLLCIVVYIYCCIYYNGDYILFDVFQDWLGNFVYMLGIEGDDFKNLMWFYLMIYVDYEGGNVFVYVIYLVGFIFSDVYYFFVGGMNVLVGLLYGLVNQEVICWIFKMLDVLGIKLFFKE